MSLLMSANSTSFNETSVCLAVNPFVKLVAYLDESGTHDRTGAKCGSEVVTLAGWIAWREEWARFCSEWQTVLQRHGAPYFHFYEWVEASAVIRGKHKPSKTFEHNPFRDWPLNVLDDFLLQLGAIARSGNKVMLGGFVSTRDFDKAKTHPDYTGFAPFYEDPYRQCLVQFFHKFSLELRRSGLTGPSKSLLFLINTMTRNGEGQ